jgi:dTDP-4-dehydrorhamnose reductase
MNIVIIGSGGRLGAALAREYRKGFQITAFDRKALDIGDERQLRAKLEPLDVDLMINCAALTNVDYCETHRGEAFQINAEAPRVLAEICNAKNARLIHISTDYVFDGEKREAYTEEDPANAISVYGDSKLEGEKNVLAIDDRHLVILMGFWARPAKLY